MRFVMTLVLGIVAGYILSTKKDETIEAVADKIAESVSSVQGALAQKYTPSN